MTIWEPMKCPTCGHEDQVDEQELNEGVQLLCDECFRTGKRVIMLPLTTVLAATPIEGEV